MATLYVIATPIGNAEDITFRAVRILGEVDALACEDTRKTTFLFNKYNIAVPAIVFAYHEHNEQSAGKRIVDLLESGKNIALCSNAGYPSISDPGYRVIADVASGNHRIEVIPGPSAAQAALVMSGLPVSSYTFMGFPPRKSGQRKNFLSAEKAAPHTLILYESPFRIHRLLGDAFDVLGNRRAAVCVELTKKFERIYRGWLAELNTQLDGKNIKGEITVVIAGNNKKFIKSSPAQDAQKVS
ncbi:MAG: 16S rRNA (cytidine(1402)-2'-O)-methyltransferase [Chitinivibrionales bacterium]|nr:16S rRNA (cytidine(1402)-2'-O)-methyltransferase [Chitinivibrionales bacterium]